MHSFAQRLRYLYLAYFSKPAGNRALYGLIRRRQFCSFVELGMGSAQRAQRMIWLARACSPAATVRYCAIDPFELRPEGSGDGLSLKSAFQLLKPTGAKLRLLPGDPYAALSRSANELTGTDLVVISVGQDADALAKAWFYVPRMLHANSAVYREVADAEGGFTLKRLTTAEVMALADLAAPKSYRRAA